MSGLSIDETSRTRVSCRRLERDAEVDASALDRVKSAEKGCVQKTGKHQIRTLLRFVDYGQAINLR